MGTELCVRIEMGDEGAPQGVEIVREATAEKPSRCWRPVPPMTAMWTGPGVDMSACSGFWGYVCLEEVDGLREVKEGGHWF